MKKEESIYISNKTFFVFIEAVHLHKVSDAVCVWVSLAEALNTQFQNVFLYVYIVYTHTDIYIDTHTDTHTHTHTHTEIQSLLEVIRIGYSCLLRMLRPTYDFTIYPICETQQHCVITNSFFICEKQKHAGICTSNLTHTQKSDTHTHIQTEQWGLGSHTHTPRLVLLTHESKLLAPVYVTELKSKLVCEEIEICVKESDDNFNLALCDECVNTQTYMYAHTHIHMCDSVAVGGTFDHLHAGHKWLLVCALMCCRRRLIVGITADSMCESKKYKQFLENYSHREAKVLDFLHILCEVNCVHIVIETKQLDDVCGPAGTDTDLNALVVTDETKTGADFINTEREKKGLPILAVIQLPLLGITKKKNEKCKYGSTLIRKRMHEESIL